MKNKKEIAEAVRYYFRINDIKIKDVAEKLGTSPQAVSNQIRGLRPFSKKSAQLYENAFGFNPVFLIAGEGDLLKQEQQQPSSEGTCPQTMEVQQPDNNLQSNLMDIIRSQQDTIRMQAETIANLSGGMPIKRGNNGKPRYS